MDSLKKKLHKKHIYFSTQLPSFYKVLKSLNTSQNLLINSKPSIVKNIIPIIICDKKLQHKTEIKNWLHTRCVYFVSGGENLKNLEHFYKHINNILKKIGDKKIGGFISIGGGSVGDFTGFIASIYKRGIRVVHIPTTWLAAMDSAHGGKTALNVDTIKNVLGSYCFPQAVFIVKNLLLYLPKKQSAHGELIKIALIKGGTFYTQLIQNKSISDVKIADYLPQAIDVKLDIVNKDPYEQKQLRQVLNLGHTIGHALESYFNIPHGLAVIHGICFSLRWSHYRFKLSDYFLKKIFNFIGSQEESYLTKIPINILSALLLQDKKRISNHIYFIFIKGPGKVFGENILVQDIIKEVKRQTSEESLTK